MSASPEPTLPAFGRRRVPAPSAPVTAADRVAGILLAPDDPDAAARLDAVLVEGDPRDADALPISLEEALAALTDDETRPPALRSAAAAARARSLARRGDRAGALAGQELAWDITPTVARTADWVDVAVGTQPASRILAVLQAGLRESPTSPSLLVRAAEVALDLHQVELAREFLDRAECSDGPDGSDGSDGSGDRAVGPGRILTTRARLELQAGRPELALEPAYAAARWRSQETRPLVAIALHRVGRLDADPGLVTAVLTAPPQDIWALRTLADVLVERDRSDDALVLLDRAVALRPTDVATLISRGVVHAQVQHLDLAALDLDRAADLLAGSEQEPAEQDGVVSWTWLTAVRGEVARLRREPARAAELLGSLPEAERPPWVASSLGQVHSALGDLKQAYDQYQIALAHDGDDLGALCGVAEIDIELGGDDGETRADATLHRVVELDPRNAMALAMLGELERRRGNPALALASFDRALAETPGYAYALGGKGLALIALDRQADAVAPLWQAGRIAPRAEWILDALLAALEHGDLAVAERELRGLKRAVRADGHDTGPLQIRRARLAQARGRWSDADKLYTKARRTMPDNPMAGYEHAVALRMLGRRLEALDIIDELLATGGYDEDLWWYRIELCWDLGRLDDVRSLLETKVAEPDPPPTALAALGELHRGMGRREDARPLLEQACRENPGHVYALASLAALDRDEDAVSRARAGLRAALEIHPGYPFAVATLAALEAEQGDGEALRRLAESAEAAETGRVDRDLVVARSRCWYLLGEYDTARAVLDDHVESIGNDALVLRQRGWVDVALGRRALAAESFRAAAGLDDSPSGLVADVLAMLRVDRWDGVITVIAGRQDGVDVAQGIIALHAGAAQTAASLAAPAVARDAALVPALVAARAFRLLGRHAEAVAHARIALELAPLDPLFIVELGECLWSTGDVDRACARYADALARLDLRVHLDLDELGARGTCLFRLGRHHDAAEVFLRALRRSDQRAELLFDLVLTSLLGDDLREARILEKRAHEELLRLSELRRRGVLLYAAHTLESIAGLLAPSEAATTAATELAIRLRGAAEGIPLDLPVPVPRTAVPDAGTDVANLSR